MSKFQNLLFMNRPSAHYMDNMIVHNLIVCIYLVIVMMLKQLHCKAFDVQFLKILNQTWQS